MEEELQGRAKLSRQLDGVRIVEEADSAAAISTTTTTTTAETIVENENGDSNGVGIAASGGNVGGDESSHVLLNLLKSLEASGGNPGPVPNMMKEMGAEIPKL